MRCAGFRGSFLHSVAVLVAVQAWLVCAYDPCRNDNANLWPLIIEEIEVSCGLLAPHAATLGNFSVDKGEFYTEEYFQLMSCDAWGSSCPLYCGLCDSFGPPACDEAEVYQQKVSAVHLLQTLGTCQDCVAPLVWREHHYIARPAGGWAGVPTATWTSGDEGDPCAHAGVGCNRCGEVVSIIFGWGILPEPPRLQGMLAPSLFDLTELSELIIQTDVSVLPANRPYLHGKGWHNLKNLAVVRLVGCIHGSVPELGNLDYLLHMWFAGNYMNGSVASILGGPSVITIGLPQNQVNHNLLSAPLPRSICNMTRLDTLILSPNALEGTIPSCLRFPLLAWLELPGSRLTGPVGALLESPEIEYVDLSRNSLTGTLPETLSHLPALRAFLINHNRFTGTIPDLSESVDLQYFEAEGNRFTDARGFHGYFGHIVLRGNRFTKLPDTMFNLPGISLLDISGNNITYWPPAGVFERGTHSDTGVPIACGRKPIDSRLFAWPQLEELIISFNDLHGQDVREVLGSLALLERLRVVIADNCNMSKDLPMEGKDMMLTVYDAERCILYQEEAFKAMNYINLAHNRIEALHGGPWARLMEIDMSFNQLTHVHPAWFTLDNPVIVQNQNFRGNPGLHLPVQTLAIAHCPREPDLEFRDLTRLTLDPQAFFPNHTGGYECTTLCDYRNYVTVVDEDVNKTVLCRCLPGMYGVGGECLPCPRDHICPAGSSEPTKCPEKSTASTRGDNRQDSCADCFCRPGYERNSSVQTHECADHVDTFCSPCEANTFGAVYATPQPSNNGCSRCPPGRYTNGTTDAGAAVFLICDECDLPCTPCEPGWAAGEAAGSGCHQCSAGQYERNATCTICGPGAYQPEMSQTACIRCEGEHNTTWDCDPSMGCRSPLDCACAAGFRTADDGTCVQCGSGEQEGLSCKGGLGPVPVTVLKGYYAGTDLSVFRCFGDEERCVGGLPGQTCATNRIGLTCSSCKDGYSPGSKGSCEKCNETSALRLIGVGVLGLSLIVAFYHAIDSHSRAKQSYTEVVISSCLSLCVTVVQQYGLLSRTSVEWTGPIRDFLDAFAFSIDFNILHVQCISRQTATTNFILTTSSFLVLGIAISLVHVAFVVLRHDHRFRERRASLMCSWGAIVSLCYISVVTTNTGPLQCQEHPNGKMTSRAYPGVICWTTEEHTGMVVASVIASLAPLAFLAHAMVTVWRYPTHVGMGDAEFIKAYNFYFIRFKVKHYWFILVQIVRNFLLALTTVIPEEVLAIFTAIIVLTLSGGLTVHYHPWRCWEANHLDLILTGCVLMLYISSFTFLASDGTVRQQVSWTMFLFAAGVLGIVPFIFVRAVLTKYKVCMKDVKPFEFFLTHHKAGAGAFTRLLKIYLQDAKTSYKHFRREVFVDSDSLVHLDRLFHHVRDETETLVAICSRQLLFRPWCVGEIVTARQAGVAVVSVHLIDFEPITENFIAGYPYDVDLSALYEYGITLENIQDCFHWLAAQPRIVMPDGYTQKVCEQLTHALRRRDYARQYTISNHCSSDASISEQQAQEEQVCICADVSNPEALAAGMVLEKFLFRMQWKGMTPFLVQAGTTLPDGLECVMFICSGGCLDSAPFLLWLTSAAARSLLALPVVVEEAFRFPSSSQLADFSPTGTSSVPQKHPSQSDAPGGLQGFILTMFKGIAVSFLAQHSSEEALWLAAKSIARRVDDTVRERTLPMNDGISATVQLGWASLKNRSVASSQSGRQIGSPPREKSELEICLEDKGGEGNRSCGTAEFVSFEDLQDQGEAFAPVVCERKADDPKALGSDARSAVLGGYSYITV